jgi:cytochrome c peroxidase
MAVLGRKLFFDPALSGSGKLSCASCHDPNHAYGPPNGLAVQSGGDNLRTPGLRAVPSLEYVLNRTPIWSKEHPASRTEQLTERDNSPSGGFAWDGRFNSLRDQVVFPLLSPMEMANANPEAVAQKLAQAPYRAEFEQVCGDKVFSSGDAAFDCARRALERFQLEDPSFQPFSSKFDAVLDGRARLTSQEQHGLELFNDPERGNCVGCHLSAPGADGSHPLFTDYQFEAIGVPRNPEIPANRNAAYYDLGLCGPMRTDHRSEKSFCGMFKTPTLRNTARRGAYFHNGRFHTLKETLRWYVERDTNAADWYPRLRNGAIESYDDLPPQLRGNVDRITPPFIRHKGDQPVWTDSDIEDVMAFLKTLDDGYEGEAR